MIIVHGIFPIKPDSRDDALEVMRRMAIASRAEAGCISYEFYIGLTDPNTLLLFQEWESVDALQGHFETSHMDEFLALLPDVLDGEVSTRRYEVRAGGEEFSGDDDDQSRSAGQEGSQEYEPEIAPPFEYREKIIH